MDKLRAVLGGRDGNNDNRNVLQAANEASTLGWGTRLKGFLVFVVIGVVCTILGVCCLFIPKVGLILFIVFYTLGNICSLASTMFLMGPLKQLKRMCDKTRAFATIVMIWKIFALTLLFVILQVLAFACHTLFALTRDAVLKFFSMMCNMCVK
uniref:Vesicle transport protein n=1 Tax=Cyprinus carpio carpio TaxID=630221 RepID=A0A8C1EVS8_CYPCA